VAKLFIGIDTGINGACVAVDWRGEIVGTLVLPHTKIIPCYRKVDGKATSRLDVGEVFDWLDAYGGYERIISVEESPSYGMGVTSAYTSGFNSGALQAVCHYFTLRSDTVVTTVAPKQWQKALKDGKEKWTKQRSLDLAIELHGKQEFFFKPKRTADGFADASHIALWGMANHNT
jgi:hypothetical protein